VVEEDLNSAPSAGGGEKQGQVSRFTSLGLIPEGTGHPTSSPAQPTLLPRGQQSGGQGRPVLWFGYGLSVSPEICVLEVWSSVWCCER
jgi:hypothetical protein